MEIEPERIEKLAKKKDKENWKFRSFLKRCSDKKIDRIVHKLYDDVSAEIDCAKCRNCCKKLSPLLDKNEIQRISDFLKISIEEFKSKYLVEDEMEKDKYVFKEKPCPFLKDNTCSIYPVIPENCLSYPHIYKEGFVFRLISVIENSAVCPIVFNVYERLKKEVWYPDFPYKD